ncbi:Serine carboxypeptidase-like 46 [Camellia lanceoleosa]|uniref:Serine carboxypeptidase-like 46 n=1 Tax=Camellia lanceoleosa TaxID=1840588 RepID=A0ACC0F1X0_9ERIC|nr:Serine carboxypeptidase-like 46 [Camellia lanceoleosa]
MLYLETPIGVGFSYSSDSSSYAAVNDKITGIRDNLIFLHKWFVKFPQYRNTSLFIIGKSYAGMKLFLSFQHVFTIPIEPEWEEDDIYLIHRKDTIRMIRHVLTIPNAFEDCTL